MSFDRDKYIIDNLKEKAEIVKNKGYNLFALFLQGSQNYELDIYSNEYKSDIDAKAIIIPSFDDIVLNRKPISTTLVLENNEHIELKDIRIMKDMWVKQNISYIELLYTKYIIYDDTKWGTMLYTLLNMRDKISNIDKNQFLKCIKGMSMEKLKALEHPYPTIKDKIDKYGYDPKQLHHIMRLAEFVNRYLEEDIDLANCYVSMEKELLLDVKLGKYDLDFAREYSVRFDNFTKEVCDRYISNDNKIDNDAICELNNWVSDVLRFSLKKELLDLD